MKCFSNYQLTKNRPDYIYIFNIYNIYFILETKINKPDFTGAWYGNSISHIKWRENTGMILRSALKIKFKCLCPQ